MRKFFIFTVLLLLMSSALVAQTITLKAIGIKSLERNGAVLPGTEIEVKFKFDAQDMGSIEIKGASSSANSGNVDQLYVVWYDDAGADVDDDVVSVNPFSQTAGNGTNQFRSLVFELPDIPSSDIVSFTVYSRIYAERRGNYYFSSDQESIDSDLSGVDFNGFSQSLAVNSNLPPVPSSVTITNPSFARVSQTLYGAYVYSDAEGDEEDTVNRQYQWYSCSTENGEYLPIQDATSDSYIISGDDEGSYLKFAVKLAAVSGTTPGIFHFSAASNKVTEAPRIAVSTAGTFLPESSANDGSIDENNFVTVNLYHSAFIPQAQLSGIRFEGAPPGLTVGTVLKQGDTTLQIFIAGNATEHEYDASYLADKQIDVVIPSHNMVGVQEDCTSPTGFQIKFDNNPPENTRRGEVGLTSVEVLWTVPDGLKASDSGLTAFHIWRNLGGESFERVGEVFFDENEDEYSYLVTGLTTGQSETFKIQAIYERDSSPHAPQSILATPLGFTAFSFTAPAAEGMINHDDRTIVVAVPYETDVTQLVAHYEAPGTDM